MSKQIKMREEDSVEEFNPWNRDAQLLERMLGIHDSIQEEIIMKEGKDDRKAASKEEFGASRTKEEEKVNQKLQSESNQQRFK